MISVIIPTCNRNEFLNNCLEALKPVNQSAADCYEVIVTDDSKTNVAKALIAQKFDWVKWIEGPKKGPAANRNNGAKYAKGEWLVFIDDDCVPDKNLINEYYKAIKNNPDTLAFEGAIYPDDWELLKKDMAECPVNTKGGCFWSANICVKKNLFYEIHGFNEQFLIAAQEDQEIYARILKHTPVIFCKDCIITHPVRLMKISKKIRRIPIEIKNWILFARIKHSWGRIFLDGSISQMRACIKTIQQKKFKVVIYHFFSLVYLVPGIILFAFKHGGKQKI